MPDFTDNKVSWDGPERYELFEGEPVLLAARLACIREPPLPIRTNSCQLGME